VGGVDVPLDIRWNRRFPSNVNGSDAVMKQTDLLQGTLDMLILRVLSRGGNHGWGIADRIAQLSKSVLSVGEGSLYPALYRLQDQGWIESEWGTSENNRKAKYYRLTKAGRKQLDVERESWELLTGAIGEILRSA
jgi:PadR family transcriptional regulator PadR